MKIKTKPQTKRKTAPIGTVNHGALGVRRQRKSRRWRLFADVSLRRGTGNFASLFLQKSIRPQPGPSFPREACGLRGGPLVRSRRAPFERSAPRYENQNKTSNKAKDRPYWDGQSWRAWSTEAEEKPPVAAFRRRVPASGHGQLCFAFLAEKHPPATRPLLSPRSLRAPRGPFGKEP